MAPRNPTWARDELIIALDLYLRLGMASKTHPEVLAASALLNRLPIHEGAKSGTFRNPTGVALKMANFAALDPAYSGSGMTSIRRGDAQAWDDLAGDPGRVRDLALKIAGAVPNGAPPPDISLPSDDEADVPEGAVLYRLHRARERDRTIVRKKKEAVLRAGDPLACEGCGIVFSEFYGPKADGYIEVHHRIPLHVSGPTRTRLSDLALLCANCHRVVHFVRPWLSVEDLRKLVRTSRR